MWRVTIGIILLALLAVPASAQRGGGGGGREVTQEEILKKKEAESVDKQYNSTLKRMKENDATPVRTDPWANMRGPPTSDAKR